MFRRFILFAAVFILLPAVFIIFFCKGTNKMFAVATKKNFTVRKREDVLSRGTFFNAFVSDGNIKKIVPLQP